ncbi:MAG: VCBS repeat-containing protein, partial [Anaerolineaceae bacterium]|nr:VCBS repeat-containing protein [Anaerolineaceae bacterium]
MAIETTIVQSSLADRNDCDGTFQTHILPHSTTVPGGDEVRMFEANGSGVGINDLDNDGLMDIVLANHGGPNSILWNLGDLNFERAVLGDGNTRAVTIIDLDADGRRDIIFSRVASAPNLWANLGDRQFEQEILPGIAEPLYSINWADVDQDGDLDLAGATYDAELLTLLGAEFLDSHIAGVYLYENAGNSFVAERLADEAQALALLLSDINGDGRPEILVGNDFAVPDYSWTRSEGTWLELWPFETMSHSTMSFDSADLNNDRSVELFSTDMKPYASDEETMAAWEPVMTSM